MKNAKFNNNRKISSSSNNSNYNKKLSQNNINIKENNKAILKKPTKQNIINNTNISNNKNKNDAKLINKQQKNIKEKNSKANIEMKKNEQDTNSTNENNKINEEKKIKKIYYDLKLSKDEFNKIIINNNKSNNNKKIIPKTSKITKSQSNDNLYRYNNEKVTLKNLNEKQKSLYDLINSINSKKNYMKECSLNNLSENNIIYKNIQEQKMKSLDDEEKNALNKIDLIQRQIKNLSQNNKNDESKNKDNKQKDYKSKFKKYKMENQKIYETNFKNANINVEKKLNDLLLLEKNQKEKEKIELIEKIKRRHSLEKMHIEKMNLEEEKYKKYINSNNERGSAKNYLYFKIEKSFNEKQKKIMNDSKNKNRDKKEDNDKDKEREEYLNKKRMEMKQNINNLHKMWKERNFKLPKYRSPLLEKALLSEEDCKKIESDKLESKKLLYLNRENYIKEKIQLPPINILLRKENSQRIKLIKNLRTTLHKMDNFKTMRTNSVLDNSKIKSKLNNSLGNIRKNQKQSKAIINISLKKKKTKDLMEPNDFNYLEDMKKERLLKNNSENYLFRNKNKASNQNIDIEKEKRDLVLLEQKYDMDKKLLRVKGGYINNIDLANKMNKMLLKSIENKLDIFENMVDK